ncbi:MAG: hypothetical protein ACOX7N_10020 [Lawsonibacter sp.]|jgi:hypothetical protein
MNSAWQELTGNSYPRAKDNLGAALAPHDPKLTLVDLTGLERSCASGSLSAPGLY